ncbi:MAG: phosphoribosylglycinamide formyltransferase [Salinivirgaceae bacterium]|jgi:phosphoribosylglycinamide formyltransferase-1|nr:phosphoribosylglycinamide formyltransferase [Salinivirgaceae bacterium]
MESKIKRIVIFASGSGTNAEAIINHFSKKPDVQVSGIFVNKPDAYVITRAKKHYVPVFTFNRNDFYDSNRILNLLYEQKADCIVLAGFLWLMPTHILEAFPNAILNIHPALLPAYGGKGMYGDRVHKAVWENGESETGITIHLVNEKYDEGKVVFQEKVEIQRTDTPETIAGKVHQLEHQYYPKVIEQFLRKNV